MKNPERMGKLHGAGTLYWWGAAGTWFWVDPKDDLFYVGMIQRYDSGASMSTDLDALSQTLVYAALVDPGKQRSSCGGLFHSSVCVVGHDTYQPFA